MRIVFIDPNTPQETEAALPRLLAGGIWRWRENRREPGEEEKGWPEEERLEQSRG